MLACVLLLSLGTIASATVGEDGGTGLEPTSSDASSPTTSEPEAAPDGGIVPEGGGGGGVNNEVVVLNTVDGRFAHRSRFGIARVTGDTVHNQNAAAATASCVDCRTVAVAVQIVLAEGEATDISPTNLAVAINNGCIRCETFAAAYQYVITTDGLVRFSPEGQQQLVALQDQLHSLVGSDDVPFYELEAQIDAVVEQMWAVADEELIKVGRPAEGDASKDTDVAIAEGSPTATPTDPASEDPTTTSTPTSTESPDAHSPTTSPSPSGSPSESASPSPSESESESPEESPSPESSPTP